MILKKTGYRIFDQRIRGAVERSDKMLQPSSKENDRGVSDQFKVLSTEICSPANTLIEHKHVKIAVWMIPIGWSNMQLFY